MAVFPYLINGELDDRMRLVVGGRDVHIFEQYEVRQSFFSAPSSFAGRFGSGGTVLSITSRCEPGTDYSLNINGVDQHVGRLDGYTPEGSSGATEVTIRGRDQLSALFSSYITRDRSFSNLSYVQLVGEVLQACGITEFTIQGDNAANRLAIAGASGGKKKLNQPRQIPLAQLTAEQKTERANNPTSQFFATQTPTPKLIPISQLTVEQKTELAINPTAQFVQVEPSLSKKTGQSKPLQAKAGKKWWEFLQPELVRAGLFIFAGRARGEFILAQPAPKKDVLYELARQRNAPHGGNHVNVLSARHHNDTTNRYSHYFVHGRGGTGTKKSALSAVGASFVDEEMLSFGINRPWCHVDPKANNSKRALYLAKRKCTEDRRQGWSLVYTVKGHTAPLVGAASINERVVWAVDTTVAVRDDELGLYDFFWIESVTFRCTSGGTTTELVLLRPDDLVFGEADFD